MEQSTLLEVRDLRVEYTSGQSVVHALNGVSFDLHRGETLGLVGGNGRGQDDDGAVYSAPSARPHRAYPQRRDCV